MKKIKKITIIGGGTSGWMTAAALAKYILPRGVEVELVESSAIGTVGVGEATIPHIRVFNKMLGIDENEFIRETGATYKLAIRFDGWGTAESSYFHPFGISGFPINGIDFHHYWLRLKAESKVADFNEFSFGAVAAKKGRFGYPASDPDSPAYDYSYAFHLDATKYASYLKSRAIGAGVKHTNGKITKVDLQESTGDVINVKLESGEEIAGDLFIDCSGFRSLVLGEALGVAFESWNKWLPCDSAFALPSAAMPSPPPYTRSMAMEAGWQWTIPLQHRTGNGLVFSSAYQNDDSALEGLLANVCGSSADDAKLLRFQAGKRTISWKNNCIAIGLAAGFLEPLESTSLYLVQIAIQKLLELFSCSEVGEVERKAFNYLINIEYERVRDFLVLHYHANNRDDSEFWRYCRNMEVPTALAEKLEIFKQSAGVVEYRKGLFMPASWLAVYLGQGVFPSSFDQRVTGYPIHKLKHFVDEVAAKTSSMVDRLPTHDEFLAELALGRVKNSMRPEPKMNLYGGRE